MGFYLQYYNSPIGRLILVADDSDIYALTFESVWSSMEKKFPLMNQSENILLKCLKLQLDEYFEGSRKSFDVSIKPSGTEFQKRVWQSLSSIPYGETRTYKQQAEAINLPSAARAVGRAHGLNPICIIIPCHRVLAVNGSLRSYAGGIEVKKYLIEFEKKHLQA